MWDQRHRFVLSTSVEQQGLYRSTVIKEKTVQYHFLNLNFMKHLFICCCVSHGSLLKNSNGFKYAENAYQHSSISHKNSHTLGPDAAMICTGYFGYRTYKWLTVCGHLSYYVFVSRCSEVKSQRQPL